MVTKPKIWIMVTNYIYNNYWLGWSLSLERGAESYYLYYAIVLILQEALDGCIICRCPYNKTAAPSSRGPIGLALS